MGKKQFDYYLFIDYSVDCLGYLIIEKEKIKDFLPKISKFKHYRELKKKKAYLDSIRKIVGKNNVCKQLCKVKVRKTESTLDIFADIGEFLKDNPNSSFFISVDNKQFRNFSRMVKVFDGKNIRIVKESELKKSSFEYRISLVIDTLLNLARIKNDKF